jgi:hypothetical protein
MPATADLSAGVLVIQPSYARTGRFRLSWKPAQLGANALKTFRSLLLLWAAVVCIASGRMALAYTDFGQGRPIAAKDLAGKKFCWNAGGWTIYAADGHYTNSKGGHTHWSVPEPGVVAIGQGRRQFEVLTDGRIHNYHFCIYCANRDIGSWGTLCN